MSNTDNDGEGYAENTPHGTRHNLLGLFFVGCLFVTLLFGPGDFSSPWGLAVVVANILAVLGLLMAVLYIAAVLSGYEGGNSDAE